jgi:hypothetical protein
MENSSQFHQHFTSSFLRRYYLVKQLLNQTAIIGKLHKTLLHKIGGIETRGQHHQHMYALIFSMEIPKA